jgi:hypothetical protein
MTGEESECILFDRRKIREKNMTDLLLDRHFDGKLIYSDQKYVGIK